MTHWFMSDIQQNQIDGGWSIEILTDVPCHLWLRYTNVTPVQHRKFILRRGIYADWDYRQCFVAYRDIEQEQDGDTANHIFTWLGWYHCLWQWFYFWGSISGAHSPSTSPIFGKHYAEPVYPTEFIEPWDWYGLPVPDFLYEFIEYWSS